MQASSLFGMLSPDRMLLSSNPDGVEFERLWVLEYHHPLAITLCVLAGGVDPLVMIHRSRPHMFIYHGLQRCEPQAGQGQWSEMLAEYGVETVCGCLTREIVEVFHAASVRCHGFPREEVTSGRLWLRLREPEGEPFHVMAFWNQGAERPDGAPAIIAKALGFNGPTYLAAAGASAGKWHVL